ncbi:MAG: 50S ribosomal protein L13 [Candidatus Nanohaloarchaea archaeon]
MIVDAENKIAGRLATKIAREIKDGEEVKIVNSEKAVISGDEEKVKDEYRQKYERGSRDFGPYYPKRPDKILKRIIRGMVPDRQESKVKTYLGTPTELDEPEELEVKEGDDLRKRNYVKLGEVSKSIGWTPRGEN